jgi:hypothetical protein
MFGNADLTYELSRERKKTRRGEDHLVSEAKKILRRDLFAEKKILEHLKLYRSSFEVIDEEELDSSFVFTVTEIKRIAVLYRLKFLDSGLFKSEIPYEATLKLGHLNEKFHKEIKEFKLLAPPANFSDKPPEVQSLLFIKTNYDNYYLLHSWGKPLKQSRKWLFLPLREFETLVLTVVIVTLLIALSLPTRLITLDHSAGYWSGYRAAAFFHLLIFNFGVTVYFTFAFAKNFSSSVWNRYTDF